MFYHIPEASPDAVASDFFISPALNERSSFILASSLGEGKWEKRPMFWAEKKGLNKLKVYFK